MTAITFPGFMIERFSRGETKSVVILCKDRELGTKSFMRLYDLVIKGKKCIGNDHGKKLIPIYMSLYEYSGEIINNNYIVEHIWQTVIGQEKKGLPMNIVAGNVINIFESPNSEYHFLLLLDGFNERTEIKHTASEIRMLSSKMNVTVCVIADAETDTEMFSDEFSDDFDIVRWEEF